MLIPTEERGFKLAVELDVTLPAIDDDAAAIELVRAAHEVCPYSNATRGNIDVTLTANGRPARLARRGLGAHARPHAWRERPLPDAPAPGQARARAGGGAARGAAPQASES